MSTNEHRINAALSTVTKRDARSYRLLFGIGPDERALDLGSGLTRFATLPNLVQLDQIYTEPWARPKGPAVAAIYQELPFLDDSFDRVTCRYGNLTLSNAGGVEMVSEALRVTRPEGKIQVYPVYVDPANRYFLHRVRGMGYDVRFEPPWRALAAEIMDTNPPSKVKIASAIGVIFCRTLAIRKIETMQGEDCRALARRLGPLVARLSEVAMRETDT